MIKYARSASWRIPAGRWRSDFLADLTPRWQSAATRTIVRDSVETHM